MKIAIEKIEVNENMRIRKELGDLQPLEESIKKVGLLNPIVVDERGELLAGYRRLSACKNLGMTEVDVTVIEMAGDKIRKLDVELAENFHRKDFTPEEILASEERRKEILESLREKTTWEKCKLWFKNLFTAPPPDEPQKDTKEDSKNAPVHENPGESMGAEGSSTEAEINEQEKAQNPDSPTRNTTHPTNQKKKVVVKDKHAIKWRTS